MLGLTRVAGQAGVGVPGNVSVSFVDAEPQYFNLTDAEGIESIAAWTNNPAFTLSCGNNVMGVSYPITECVQRIEGTLVSSQFGNVTFSIDPDQLPWAPNATNPEQYTFGIPLNKFAMPNVLYSGGEAVFVAAGVGGPVSFPLPAGIYNMFNASSSSLREYYGVQQDLQGSDKTVQGTTLSFGIRDAHVNSTALSEYLELQGLVPNNPLQFSDWAPPNSGGACVEINENCVEEMLDVQTMQAFAPQAITYFAPNEVLPMSRVFDLLPSDVVAIVEDAYPAASSESYNDLISSDGFPQFVESLDPKIRVEIEDAISEALKRYFTEFVNNVTTSEERVSVVSLSWSSSYQNPFQKDMTMAEKSERFGYFEDQLRDLTLSGISILISSGDAGASSSNNQPCLKSSNPLESNQEELWPIISPWVTVVGGTQFLATEDNPQEEVVCSAGTGGLITSGGGFTGTFYPEDIYSTPAWQEKAVGRYLAENNASTFDGFPTGDTPGYNPGARAYPDIAMYGAHFPVFGAVGGELLSQAGTSLSAPIAASVFSLVNQKLLEDGYEVIGYANPMIYWMGENCTEAFNDITVGDNQVNEKRERCLYGYPAVPGWDASTGFGSIKFEPFVNCAKRYQDEVRSKGLEILPNGTYWRSSTTTDVVPPETISGNEVASATLVAVVALAITGWF